MMAVFYRYLAAPSDNDITICLKRANILIGIQTIQVEYLLFNQIIFVLKKRHLNKLKTHTHTHTQIYNYYEKI